MIAERLPSQPANELLRSDRALYGIGYVALLQAIATQRHGLTRQLEERRPIHVVAESAYRSTDYTDFLKDMLADSFRLPNRQRELINTHHAAQFREADAERIIADRSRPFILPMAVGEGRSPQWGIGPIWFINKPVYYDLIRQQLQEIQLPIQSRD